MNVDDQQAVIASIIQGRWAQFTSLGVTAAPQWFADQFAIAIIGEGFRLDRPIVGQVREILDNGRPAHDRIVELRVLLDMDDGRAHE